MFRHFILYIVLSVFLLSCTSHKEGKVVRKFFKEGHTEKRWEPTIQGEISKYIPSSYNLVVVDEKGMEMTFPVDKELYDSLGINDVFKIY